MTMNYGLSPAEQAGRRAQTFAEYARSSPDIPQRNLGTAGRMFTPSGQLPLPTITSDTADQLASQGRWQEANQMARQNPDRYRVMNTPTDLGFTGAGTTASFIGPNWHRDPNMMKRPFPQVTQYINPGGGLTSANTAMTGLRPPPTPTPVTSGPMPWASQPSNVMPTVTYPLTPGEQSAALQQRRGQARLRGMRENFLRFPDAFYNPPQGLNPTRMSGMLPGPLPNTGNWNTDLQTVINQPWNNRGF